MRGLSHKIISEDSQQSENTQTQHRKAYKTIIDVSYAALQAHGIINVALHQEYSPGIEFIFSQGRNDIYNV
jgi:hypothetical protein